MVAKHLRGAARQLHASRLSEAARSQLYAADRVRPGATQQRLRDRVRPLITETLIGRRLAAAVTSRNAWRFRKIVEELLDRIVQRGFLSLGQIRDTLSQNNLKLSDLTPAARIAVWRSAAADRPPAGDRVGRRVLSRADLSAVVPPTQRLAFGTRFGAS